MVDGSTQLIPGLAVRSYVFGIKEDKDGEGYLGTAFLLGEGGDTQTKRIFAVTCNHVVDGLSQVWLWFRPEGQTGTAFQAEVFERDTVQDIAILRLCESLPSGAEMLSLRFWKGDIGLFESFGFAAGTEGYDIPEGKIGRAVPVPRDLKHLVQEGEVLQLTLPNPVPGLSGAPIIETGTKRVVGMVFASAGSKLSNIAYAQQSGPIITIAAGLGIGQAILGITEKLNTEAHAKAMAKLDAIIKRPGRWTGGFFAINYCAPHGYAKSMLLARVWETYQGRILTCLVALKGFVEVRAPLNRVKVLRHVLRELAFRVSPQILEESGISASYEELAVADKLVAGIVSLVRVAAQFERVFLFLVDDYDVLLAADRRWFESELLGRLSAVARLGIIFTSQTPLRFDRLNLRKGLQIHPLMRLTADDIDWTFPQYSDLYPQIEELTGGLPMLTGELIARLEQSPKEVAELREPGNGSVRRYFREHAEKVIMDDIHPSLHRTLQVLAILRFFDAPTLAALLPRILPDVYMGYMTPQYLDLLAELNALTQWRAEGSYALNQAYALALRGCVAADCPVLWQKVHWESRVYYCSLLASGQYQRRYLVEALYHRLSLLQAEGVSVKDQQKTVNNDLLALVEAEATRAAISADAGLLRETLRNDLDLSSFVSEKALVRLTELERRSLATSRPLPLGAVA